MESFPPRNSAASAVGRLRSRLGSARSRRHRGRSDGLSPVEDGERAGGALRRLHRCQAGARGAGGERRLGRGRAEASVTGARAQQHEPDGERPTETPDRSWPWSTGPLTWSTKLAAGALSRRPSSARAHTSPRPVGPRADRRPRSPASRRGAAGYGGAAAGAEGGDEGPLRWRRLAPVGAPAAAPALHRFRALPPEGRKLPPSETSRSAIRSATQALAPITMSTSTPGWRSAKHRRIDGRT
jgi:hypothetical protein